MKAPITQCFLKKWTLLVLAVIVIGVALWLVHWRQEMAYAKRSLCVSRLNHIRIAKRVCEEDLSLKDGDPVPDIYLSNILADLGGTYKCPSGGTYVVGNIGTNPKCTYTNACYTYSFDHFKLSRRRWVHSLTEEDDRPVAAGSTPPLAE